MKKILFVIGVKYGSAYYRMELPAKALKDKGYHVDIVTKINPYQLQAIKDGVFGEQILNIMDYDVIVFQLVFKDWLFKLIKFLKAKGKTVVVDTDDDYFNLPADSPAFKEYHPKCITEKENGITKRIWHKESVNDSIKIFVEALRNASIVTVTTPQLAELYYPINRNIFVLENCIDNEIYDGVRKPLNDGLVIGWQGSKTHLEDLRLVTGCIPENAWLVIVGYSEGFKLFKDQKNKIYLSSFEIIDIAKVLANINIGMVPLVDNKFNSGKSDIKGLEYAAMGIPAVASKVAPYKRWIEHGVNGFFATKPIEWMRYFKLLMENQDLRQNMGAMAKKKALTRDIKNNIHKWVEVYDHSAIENINHKNMAVVNA